MDHVELGATGIRASVMGLGCGGHSRLGLSHGGTMEDAAAVVRRAVEMGVNFVDTAESYGTEPAVALGLRGVRRDSVYLSTKAAVDRTDVRSTPSEFRARVEDCLARLETDYVDVFHLHAVTPEEYPYALEYLAPELVRLRDEGKVRFIGITEGFHSDTGHEMLSKAVHDGVWQVAMVGFNILNQSARDRALAETQRRGIGTLCMFAVRKALSRPDALAATVSGLMARGKVATDALDPGDPLGFLARDGVADSVVEAAYRFCRYEPGLHVVLSGTGSVAHLEENARALSMPPLPLETHERLRTIFAAVDDVSGN